MVNEKTAFVSDGATLQDTGTRAGCVQSKILKEDSVEAQSGAEAKSNIWPASCERAAVHAIG